MKSVTTKKSISKAMILAAGLGTRLRPLTNTTPKPLMEIGKFRVIEYNLFLLAQSSIKEVVVNLHHLGEKIRSFLGDGSKYGLKIRYSFEKEILGTAGGIKKVEEFFENGPFVVTNCDIITDVPLVRVIEKHLSGETLATLVLRPLSDGESYTPVREDNGCVAEFGTGSMMYTGIQIIDPKLLKKLPFGISDTIKDLYIPLLKSGGKIGTYIHKGFWTEIGIHEQLERARRAAQEDRINFSYLKR